MLTHGRYIILGEIASGGTATVFLAEDSVLHRKVALKKLHPHLLNHPEMVKRFEKEAVAVASLSHENVIKIYDFGSEGAGQGLFLAMEYVDGISLDRLIRDVPGGLPILAALSVCHQLLEGLAAAHACGIYHRDIKPSNVLVDRKGCVRIADFGIAFLAEETSITRAGSYLGTPGYSAPEQAEGKAVTAKTDIFATGTLLYQALTGVSPFAADTPHAVLMAVMDRVPAKADFVNRRLFPGMADLINDMLAKDPEKRPSASECARRIESLLLAFGFSLDGARICRLMESPLPYLEAERSEISQHFAELARAANASGKVREAMKLFSLAEIFADENSTIHREASLLQVLHKAAARKRMAALAFSALLVAVGGAVFLVKLIPPHAARALPEPTPDSAQPSAPVIAAVVPNPPPEIPVPAPREPEKPDPESLAKPEAKPPKPVTPRSGSALARTALHVPRDRAKAGRSAGHSESSAPKEISAPAGLLWIKTNPPFAKIQVDGRELGATPMSAPISLAVGSHHLDLERAGCEPIRTEFRITDQETTSLRFTLNRLESAP